MTILVHFVYIWYNFSGFGIMCHEKSGNPGRRRKVLLEERKIFGLASFRRQGNVRLPLCQVKRMLLFFVRTEKI
jgi:hypothetical protein